jgi:hypothetical protein
MAAWSFLHPLFFLLCKQKEHLNTFQGAYIDFRNINHDGAAMLGLFFVFPNPATTV